jgi:NADH:ubiquinone oxidoreductase subunit K
MDSQAARLFVIFAMGVVLTLTVGFYSLLTTKNLLRALIAIEILAKATTLSIIVAGYLNGRTGLAQALAITLIVIEVAVIVVAIGIVLCIYQRNRSLDTTLLRNLKG